MDLAILWVMEENLEMVEGILAVVETLVEEESMVVEEVAPEEVMKEVTVDIMNLEVVVMMVGLVTVLEGDTVVLDQDVETKVVGLVVVEEDMMLTTNKGGNFGVGDYGGGGNYHDFGNYSG